MQRGQFGKAPGWGRSVPGLLNDKCECFLCFRMKANWNVMFLIKHLKSWQGSEHQKVLVSWLWAFAGCWNSPAPRDLLLLFQGQPTDRPAPSHPKHHSEGRNLQSVPSWKWLSCDEATPLYDSVPPSLAALQIPGLWSVHQTTSGQSQENPVSRIRCGCSRQWNTQAPNLFSPLFPGSSL